MLIFFFFNSNKADLAIINRIRAELNPSNRTAISQLSSVRRGQHQQSNGQNMGLVPFKQGEEKTKPGVLFRRLLKAVRFVVRMQIGAREWGKHEMTRQRLADRYEEMEKEERIRQMREQWRKQVKRNIETTKGGGASSSSAGGGLLN